ncbi:MAG: hypothetical protein C0469_15160 [Cyanobacteria bacterium DS2.3.42]|nr:hypothetical protein [Cyanobacteria bacterium DS2.3.42]
MHKFRKHLQSPGLQMFGNADSESFGVVMSPGGGVTKPRGGFFHFVEAGTHVAFRLFVKPTKGDALRKRLTWS